WVATIHSDVSWFLYLLPDEVQDEVFSTTEGRGCASFTPGASRAVSQDEGFLVTGSWAFQTGSPPLSGPSSPPSCRARTGLRMAIFAMPVAQGTVEDDWYTAGLRGSGSDSVSAGNAYLPRGRVLRVTEPSKRAGSAARRRTAATGLTTCPCPPSSSPAWGRSAGWPERLWSFSSSACPAGTSPTPSTSTGPRPPSPTSRSPRRHRRSGRRTISSSKPPTASTPTSNRASHPLSTSRR